MTRPNFAIFSGTVDEENGRICGGVRRYAETLGFALHLVDVEYETADFVEIHPLTEIGAEKLSTYRSMVRELDAEMPF